MDVTFQPFINTIGTDAKFDGEIRDRMGSAGGGKLVTFMTKMGCGNYCGKRKEGIIPGNGMRKLLRAETGCKI